MKKITILCSMLIIGLFILAGCTNSDNLPNISGEMTTNIYKTVISVKTTYVDTENHDLYNDAVNLYATITSTGDEIKELSRKNIVITKPSEPEISLTGGAIEFTSLTADTTYELKLIMSANGAQRTLDTKKVTTINNGESEEDPILIDSLDLLIGMNKEKNAYYKLVADIDCGGAISSIFNSSSYFSGSLDGDGHKIYNYKIESNSYSGLFGYMTGATVKNLVLEDVSYEATRSDTYLGALAGYAKNCTITNVTVKNVKLSHQGQSSKTAYIGGLVGMAENSTITNCSVSELALTIPRAQLRMYIGGFVGENEKTLIENCSVEGTISATIYYTSNENGCLYLGGFSGVNDSNKGIKNSYAKVDISVNEPETSTSEGYKTLKSYIGGFSGGNIHDGSYFKDCASIGKIVVVTMKAATVNVGGFAGYTDDVNISRFENCIYYPTEEGLTLTLGEETPEVEAAQTVYVSLTIGKIGAKTTNHIMNVISFRDLLVIANEHSKTNRTSYVVSDNVTGFSTTIRDLILAL